MILPGLPGGDPLPRRALADAVGLWLPPDADLTPPPPATPTDPYAAELDSLARWRYAAGVGLAAASPRAHVIVSDVEDRSTEEIMDDLFMADPDGWRLLSEWIVLDP